MHRFYMSIGFDCTQYESTIQYDVFMRTVLYSSSSIIESLHTSSQVNSKVSAAAKSFSEHTQSQRGI